MIHEADAERDADSDEKESGSFSRDSQNDFHGFAALDDSDGSSSNDSDDISDYCQATQLLDRLDDWQEEDDTLVIPDRLLPFILSNTDEFCERLHGNTFIKNLHFSMDFRLVFHPEEAVRKNFVKLGEAFARLVALQELNLIEYGRFSGMTAAADIVRQTRQIRSLCLQVASDSELDPGVTRDLDAYRLANALSCHPALEEIHTMYLSSEEVHLVNAILPTLPRIRKVTIDCSSEHSVAELKTESLSQLLNLPSLRELSLENCGVSELGLRVIGNCLRNGSLLSTLTFKSCQLPEQGASSIVTALEHNCFLKQLHFVYCGPDPSFYSALKNGLSANRTLAALTMNGTGMPVNDQCLSMAFEGLKTNQSLETLYLLNFPWTSVVSDGLRESLEANSGLRKLSIRGYTMNNDSWRRILPFLGANSTLEFLEIEDWKLTEAIIPDMAEALEKNSGLRRLRIDNRHFSSASLVDFVGSLTSNVSLKELTLVAMPCSFGNEAKAVKAGELVAAAKRNFGLEKLNVTMDNADQKCLLECILRLNQAGRSYLIQDPTSKEEGFRVLLKVRNDLNCLFLHLQENPLLCRNVLTADGRAPQAVVSTEEE